MESHNITTPARFTYFLANVAEETGQLQARQENLNYSGKRLVEIFPSMFKANPQKAHDLARLGAEAIGNHIYADVHRPPGYRMGNVQPGDGWKYRGRGPMQITGRTNYVRFFRALGLPDESDPDLLLQPDYGAMSAAEYWSRMGCNELADAGDFVRCVIKVNGGTTGLASRSAYLRRLCDALSHTNPTLVSTRPAAVAALPESVEDSSTDVVYRGSRGRPHETLEPIPPMAPVPPPGYEMTETGNVMRAHLSESAILKSARVGQRIAWGAGIATGIMTGLQALKEAFVSMFAGVTPALLIGVGGVAVLLAAVAFVYFRRIERTRVEMHQKGIA